MDYGFALVKWSSDPGVFRTELILALCAAIVTFVSVWKIARSNRATGRIVMWLGLGMLGLGILSCLVGQTGFQVVALFDELERQEMLYVILGVISAVIGGLMAFIGAAFMFMKGAKAQPSGAE
jgi:Mn2+/Fe2+ NRAMP family transporter